MFAFVFPYVENLTRREHSDGGLVVIAENIDRAIELARKRGVLFNADEILKVDKHLLADKTTPEKVYIFPNAGCC